MDSGSNEFLAPTATELFGDSRWFPEGLDARTRDLTFVRIGREQIAAPAFLSKSVWAQEDLPRHRLGLQTVATASALSTEKPVVHFIWHSAYCCSTLLSR